MMGLPGQLALIAAALAAAATLGACAGALRREAWLRHARAGLALLWLSLSGAAAALIIALLRSDMRLEYVADHTERALGPAFRVAAFWSGQEGSLLLWAWLIAGYGALAAALRRRETGRGEAVTLGVLAAVAGYFVILLLALASPFKAVTGGTRLDGSGLDPLLQHWAMIAHPPILFLGYAGFTVPFAITMGALAAGRKDDAWVGQLRRWALSAWLFQGVGITLGAYWAYVELGWGGYWAWDPVENASLLPWLTGTALLHVLPVHQRRGLLRGWTAPLASLTFLLCIVGTWLTRSGAVQSVHAFSQSSIGLYFLALLGAAGACSVGLIACRLALWKGPGVERLASREGAVMLGAVLLVVMALATLAGTTAPVLTSLLGLRPISVGPSFYNRAVAPLGIACGALMAIAPVLGAGPVSRRRLLVPAALSAGACAAALALGLLDAKAHACVAIAAFCLGTLAHDAAAQVAVVMRHGVGPAAAALRMIAGNHRRLGGQLAHAGMGLVFIGIAGSSLLASTQLATLKPGESSSIGAATIRLDGLREVRGPNYTAVEATVTLTGIPGGPVTLTPQRRFYDRALDGTATVAIRSSPRRDLYIALAGWEAGGVAAAIQVRIIPLALWIWIGAGAVAAGGALAVLPRLLPGPARRAVAAPAPIPLPTIP